ncbi:MAG: hypothetical protein QOI46_6684 [Alphaproteobacteria bacterium]|nr:hypothetical protein [Alphaproteobacteria bacterium]
MFAPHYANILKTRRYVGSWHETDVQHCPPNGR